MKLLVKAKHLKCKAKFENTLKNGALAFAKENKKCCKLNYPIFLKNGNNAQFN